MMMVLMAAALMDPASVAAAAGRFAGRPVAVDARLQLADCAEPLFALAGERVEVRCERPAWRVFLPFRSAAEPVVQAGVVKAGVVKAGPAIRRGERVVVLVEGRGFTVSMDAVADGDARDGRVWVRSANGEGRRMLARIREDGHVVIEG